MALKAISGAAYNDSASISKTTKTDTTGTQQGTTDLNITETTTGNSVSGNKQPETDLEKGQKEKLVTESQIKDAIANANNKLKNHWTRCEYTYHEDIKRISIKVIDRESDKVLMEVPSEDTIEMIRKLYELSGLLVDEKR